jgi:hypothetical protein
MPFGAAGDECLHLRDQHVGMDIDNACHDGSLGVGQ